LECSRPNCAWGLSAATAAPCESVWRQPSACQGWAKSMRQRPRFRHAQRRWCCNPIGAPAEWVAAFHGRWYMGRLLHVHGRFVPRGEDCHSIVEHYCFCFAIHPIRAPCLVPSPPVSSRLPQTHADSPLLLGPALSWTCVSISPHSQPDAEHHHLKPATTPQQTAPVTVELWKSRPRRTQRRKLPHPLRKQAPRRIAPPTL
jgi:hypothetical protein